MTRRQRKDVHHLQHDVPEPTAAPGERPGVSLDAATHGQTGVRQPTIGILSTELGDAFYGNLIAGMHQTALQAGGRVIAIQTLPQWREDPVAGDARAYLPYAQDLVDGYVVVLDAVSRATLLQLKGSGKPLVSICAGYEDLGIPAVFPDNRTGITAMVRHLLQHGHTRIGFVGCMAYDDVRDRYAAYQTALADQGIALDAQWCFDAPDMEASGGRAAGVALLAAGMPCSAVCAATDDNALGLMAQVQRAGYHIPTDLAVAGFDDLPLNALISPALTTVQQDNERLGAEAVRLVLAMLAGQAVPPRRLCVPSAPVYRQSCGCYAYDAEHPARGDDGAQGGWPESLRQAMGREVGDDVSHVPSGRTSAAVAGVEACIAALEDALRGGPLPAPGALSAACRSLCACGGGVEAANRAIMLLEKAAHAVLDAGVPDGAKTEVVRQLLLELRIELLYAARFPFAASTLVAQESACQNYQAGLAMLGQRSGSVRDLAWLRGTPAEAGCLGLWHHEIATDELAVAGAYRRGAEQSAVVGDCYHPESFPPLDLFEHSMRGAPLHVPMVLPLQTAERDWGVLALLSPVERHTNPDSTSVSQWSVLLIAALEREHLQSLRASEERYAVATRGTNDGLWDWDLRGNTVYYSSRWKEMVGCVDDDVEPTPVGWFSLVHPEDRAELEGCIAGHIEGGVDRVEQQYRLLHRDGTYRWMLCRGIVVREGSVPVRIAGSQTDISAQRQLETRLVHLAQYDVLTDLPNRIVFLERLDRALDAYRDTAGVSVLSLDLDNFKVINDSLGHEAGDQVLIAVAARLRHCVRAADTLARFSGDEFAILLCHEADRGLAVRMADRILQALRLPFSVLHRSVVVGASIGIVLSTPAHTPSAVMRDADVALYRAKAAGRGRYAVFDEAMSAHAVERLELEADLRRAVERNEFTVYYQPKVDLASGAVLGMEALVRWLHPDRGLVGPAAFITLAEETGLIAQIGQYVLEDACHQTRRWNATRPVPLVVSVNLSARQFIDPTLADDVQRAFAVSGVDPHCMQLEITESVAMSDVETTQPTLRALKALGVQLAIDDFGTGYSSLAYLKRFAVDALKIDRAFVTGLHQDSDNASIVQAVVSLGRALRLSVVAEGIESQEEADCLRSLGCAQGQGYYFARPLSRERADAFLGAPSGHRAAPRDDRTT